MTARLSPLRVCGSVVDLAVERARRRGDGWPALEVELTEVPPELVDRTEPVFEPEQLSLLDRERWESNA